jgi:hypothetical protein
MLTNLSNLKGKYATSIVMTLGVGEPSHDARSMGAALFAGMRTQAQVKKNSC